MKTVRTVAENWGFTIEYTKKVLEVFGVRVTDPDYNEWFRKKADEDFRRANHFSRGGRMSTPPKSFRVPGGYRVGRAEGLGNDEYDVYF